MVEDHEEFGNVVSKAISRLKIKKIVREANSSTQDLGVSVSRK